MDSLHPGNVVVVHSSGWGKGARGREPTGVRGHELSLRRITPWRKARSASSMVSSAVFGVRLSIITPTASATLIHHRLVQIRQRCV